MYSCVNLCRSGHLGQNAALRNEIAGVVDSAVVVTLLAIAAITIYGAMTQTHALLGFKPLYPIGAYTMIGAAGVIIFADLTAYLIKRTLVNLMPGGPGHIPGGVGDAGNGGPGHVPGGASGAGGGAGLAVPPHEANRPFATLKQLAHPEGQKFLAEIQPILDEFAKQPAGTSIEEWFVQKVNSETDGKLQTAIKNYLAWHFNIADVVDKNNIPVDVVGNAISKDNRVLKNAITASLEISGIFAATGQMGGNKDALVHLETALKASYKEWYDSKFETHTANQSPFAFMTWDEIPLQYLLVLSDGNYYDMRPKSGDEDTDLAYISPCVDPSHNSPITTVPLPEKDRTNLKNKLDHLSLMDKVKSAANALAPNANTNEEAYRRLTDLIIALVRTPAGGDFGEVVTPFLDLLDHPAIQQLAIPDRGNATLSSLNLYNFDMHLIAVYLWNALKQIGYALPERPRKLIQASILQGVALL